jgi:hypothetical protein
MNTLKQTTPAKKHGAAWTSGIALLALAMLTSTSHAYPIGRVTIANDAPFAGSYAHSLTANDGLFTLEGWADANASVSANLWNWWILLGVDSGTGNGALIDGTESVTLQLDKPVGAAMLFFTYTGGNGSGAGNLARLSISGFSSDPGASCVPTAVTRITNISYSSGVLSFDYLDDGGGSDTGQLILANPAASAGRRLILTVAASPNGNATSAFAAIRAIDIQEAVGGPQIHPSNIPQNTSSTYATTDGLLTVRGYSDLSATTPANLGRYNDECFGIAGPSTVSGNNSITLQLASDASLLRLDSRYSGGTLTISGFTGDPGLVDPTGGTTSSSYSSGTLTVVIGSGGAHPFYFTNRAASAGQTLTLNNTANQFGIGGIGYAKSKTLIAPDVLIASDVSPTFTTADGLLTLIGYSDTPGTIPANLHENFNWFGISGGSNNESIEGAESLSAQFAGGAGLTGIGTRYTSGQVIISGFVSDPGFSDPSGIATGVTYSAGTLSYTFDAPRSPEIVVNFANLAASAGQTLSLHTDGGGGSQLTLTRINYATAAAPVTLTIVKSGSDVVLTWPNGTLQSSTNAAAFYLDVSGATSPYTNSATGAQMFFRVKVQ